MTEYYLLFPSTMDPCTLQKAAYNEARRSWLCLGCNFPKPGTECIDAPIQEYLPGDIPLNFIFGCGIGIARKSFLYRFGESLVHQHLHIGRVFGPNGQLLDDWVTINGKYKIIVRGAESAGVRKCAECGRNVYFALGRRYVYPKPSEGVCMFDTGDGGIVLTSQLFSQLNLSVWRKVEWVKLPVLDVPLDGLVDLKSVY